MNEQTVTRPSGQDAAWSAWQAAAADRADAPHPDPVRSEAAPAARPLPTGGATEAFARVDATHEGVCS